MRNQLVFKRFRYSSLLRISSEMYFLKIKGPLGTIYLRTPYSDLFKVKVDDAQKLVTFAYSLKKRRGKSLRMKVNSFFSILETSCYGAVFGSMSFLSLEGLGFRFYSPEKKTLDQALLKVKIGNSSFDSFSFNLHRARLFTKDPRNLILYGIDFSTLRNIAHSLALMKKPDKYKFKGFTVSHIH